MPYVPKHSFDFVQYKDFLFEYLPQLETCKTLSEKISTFKELFSLTNKCLKERDEVCQLIQKILSPYYPNSLLYMYGSSSNGFGTKGSDLDLLFLPCPEYCKLGTEEETDDAVPILKLVNSEEVSTSDMLKIGEKQHLLFILRLLRKSGIFQNVVFIPAKCPILNFLVIRQNNTISCDLSCRNTLVVHNTELLYFFGRTDSRVDSLVIALRHWAKCMGFIKPGSFSSYAFTLLIIFFLQTIDPPVLPSVNFLMENAGQSHVVAGWEVAFTNDLSLVPPTQNKNTLGELFRMFFSYYWDFDFTRNVVCIRNGSPLPIKSLKESSNEGIRNMEVSCICIQDPFNLSHNVSKAIKHNGLPYFKPSLLVLSKKLQKLGNEVGDSEFQTIFDEKAIMEEVEKTFLFKTGDDWRFQIMLDNDMMVSVGDDIHIMRSWYERACTAVFETLHYGLLMDCEVIDKSPILEASLSSSITKHEEKVLDIYDSLLTIQCVVYDRVWCNRKKFTNITEFDEDAKDMPNDLLKIEHMISKTIIGGNILLSSPQPLLMFLCNCYKCKFPQLPHLFVTLTPYLESKESKCIFKFLEAFIPKTVSKILGDSSLSINV